MISIVIPTVTGREENYRTGFKAYIDTTKHLGDIEILTYANRETCGIAWQEGAEKFIGDYLHFTADDLIPHDGWADAAMKAADDGIIPMPTIYGPSGAIEELGPATVGCTRIPFCTREQWEKIGPMIPAHYYTDNYFSERAKRAGYLLQEVPEYAFTHTWAQPGRGAGMKQQDRMVHDERLYGEALK